MAAEVSSILRIMNEYKQEDGKGTAQKALITRDLLGGCSKLGPKELDLDLHVPYGWEKRLDLKSGNIYLHQREFPISASSIQKIKEHQQLQDLNFPPSSSSNLLEESLDLKLVPSMEYQSVCTLEKVKSALERAERESSTNKKRSFCRERSAPTPASSSEQPKSENKSPESVSKSEDSDRMFAAGCPGCLLYVLISKAHPRCPRCETLVPFPILKKPKIDLNSTL